MADRVTIHVQDETYEITEAELARYEELVAAGIEQTVALQRATGDFEDVKE